MTGQSPGQRKPDDWSRGYAPGDRGAYVFDDDYAGEPYYGAGTSGSARPGPAGLGAARPAPGNAGRGMAGAGMPTTPIWQDALPPLAAEQASYRAEPEQPGPGRAEPAHGAGAKGFLSALFDFSFTSFVTTRIIKVLYVLITILAVLTALVYTVVAFRISAAFGFLTLVIGDPLFILIVMAFWRLVLEAFMVRFRIAEDVRALRERGSR